MNAEPTYLSGELIREGDSIRIGHWGGVVDYVITSDSPAWADYWKDLGEGVMLAGTAFGRVFTKFHDEDLILVERKKQ